jgi:altronate dehydratase
VAREIAERPGAVTITHQHGCSQVGDDGVRTFAAFTGCACNPNVVAVLVVGLGCETIQGRDLAGAIGERGQRVEYVGIQEAGGFDATVDAGTAVLDQLLDEAGRTERIALPSDRLVIGVERSRDDTRADAFVELALDQGAHVLLAGEPNSSGVEAFTAFPRSGGAATTLTAAGRHAQQHVAFAAAGAHAVVALPALDEPPVGFPLCPVISVAGRSPLHSALADDFDLAPEAGPNLIWETLRSVVGGAATCAEGRHGAVFALERLALSM